MDFRTDEEKQMDRIEGQLGVLREVVQLLASNCSCTVAERLSGHLTECPMPQIHELLSDVDPADYVEEQTSRARE